jgi:hypothetical protein
MKIKDDEYSIKFIVSKPQIEVGLTLPKYGRTSYFFMVKTKNSVWEEVKIKENGVLLLPFYFSKKEKEESEQLFQQLMVQIKKEPKYRLKLLPLLDERLIKIWNVV